MRKVPFAFLQDDSAPAKSQGLNRGHHSPSGSLIRSQPELPSLQINLRTFEELTAGAGLVGALGEGCVPFPKGISRACPLRKSCPNLALKSLCRSWNVGAPSGSRPSGPGSQRSQLGPSSGLELRAGEGPSGNCCHLLSSPPFPPLSCLGEPQSSSAAWWETGALSPPAGARAPCLSGSASQSQIWSRRGTVPSQVPSQLALS